MGSHVMPSPEKPGWQVQLTIGSIATHEACGEQPPLFTAQLGAGSQWYPSPIYDDLHAQISAPLESVQVALTSQPPFSEAGRHGEVTAQVVPSPE